MRFTTLQDYQTILKINKELINVVVDLSVVLYKVQQQLSKTNSYNEAPKKSWYKGVEIPLLYRREQQNPSSANDIGTVDFSQRADFSFLTQECNDRNIYPETGDIIFFDSQYYEVDNVTENQLWAGRVEYNHSIVCESHLTRKTALQLELPQL